MMKPAAYLRTALRFPLIAGLALLCAACSLQSPTQFSQKRAEIVPGYADAQMPAAGTGSAQIHRMALSYARNGNGPMEITVTYDPHSRTNTARKANDEASRISALFREYGVHDFKADILPVADSAASQLLVRYPTLTAQMPEGCRNAFDIDDTSAEAYRDYNMGCTTENYIAKQIYHPSDLLGREGTSPGSGARQNNVVDQYQSGKPNPPMKGISSTSGG